MDIGPNWCTKKANEYQCQKLCQETDGCKRFTYVRNTYNGEYATQLLHCCILRDGQDGPKYKVLQGLVSGPVRCPSAKGGAGQMYYYGEGHCEDNQAEYYKGWDGEGEADEEDCKRVCLKESECKFASFYKSGKKCARYKKLPCELQTTTAIQKDHITFIKLGMFNLLD